MAGRRGAGIRGAGRCRATAAVLTLPLWLGCCAPGSDPPSGRSFPGATAAERTAPFGAPALPAPQPQAPPPAAPASSETGPAGTPHPAPATPSATPPAADATPGTDSGAGTQASPAPEPVAPDPVAPPFSESPARVPAGTSVIAYYVLLDDGGAGGVRFGCNDSLAGIPRSSPDPAEPLAGAMGALLDGSADPGLYNALAASTLTFISGSFDGTTVTVYLAGAIRPGGVCDIPRVEAQLTQTAMTSVGALRADIYINGEPLAEALRLT